jgi:GT2 family glycosyltransferase
MTEISFIIVNYNSLDFIKNLLDSFKLIKSRTDDVISGLRNSKSEPENRNNSRKDKHTGNCPAGEPNDFFYEIVIFDNGSSDGSAGFIEKESLTHKNIKLIKSEKNEGFCRGSNRAAMSAVGKYLIFLNPDTKILDGNVKSLIDFLTGKEILGEKVGILGVKTINFDGTLQYSSRAFPSIFRQFYESFFLFKVFGRSKIFGSYFMTWWDHEDIREVDWLSGSFMFIKKEIFISVNGFDEDYFMYSEDADICYRLKRKGFKNYYYPYYSIMHLDGAIASRDLLSRELGIWKSRRLYFKKNYSLFYALNISSLYFLGVLNRLIVFCIFYIFSFKKKYKEKSKLYFAILKSYY